MIGLAAILPDFTLLSRPSNPESWLKLYIFRLPFRANPFRISTALMWVFRSIPQSLLLWRTDGVHPKAPVSAILILQHLNTCTRSKTRGYTLISRTFYSAVCCPSAFQHTPDAGVPTYRLPASTARTSAGGEESACQITGRHTDGNSS